MDLYIKEQVDNDNYIPFDLKEACQEKHQLHIVGYNFLDSSTSMSTKVKMTTDSSMKTDRGLSLNKVTKPASGDIPNLHGILNCSRCNNHFSVYNIKDFLDQSEFRIKILTSELSVSLPSPLLHPSNNPVR